MTAQHLGLEEAIAMAMEAELKAGQFYSTAALFVEDERGRDLLGRLAAFEEHHYQKLAELARSLNEGRGFVEYQARLLSQFVPKVVLAETAGAEMEGMKDQAGVLSRAIEQEKIAGARYGVLAEQTEDPAGQRMFRQLVEEERLHQRVLEDEFFSLSNQGVWSWSGLYGE